MDMMSETKIVIDWGFSVKTTGQYFDTVLISLQKGPEVILKNKCHTCTNRVRELYNDETKVMEREFVKVKVMPIIMFEVC